MLQLKKFCSSQSFDVEPVFFSFSIGTRAYVEAAAFCTASAPIALVLSMECGDAAKNYHRPVNLHNH
jgi:hypothetical protein